ncbi:MAG: prepilin-type N-terminal cleavage/methylation domain-containing protein [Candidatus Pacebacteria bacterium]|nr:prepilin-type N-terminal cleavage/methylation domain-containing protein [Candidatus Paceibacterota bacterium]
MPKNKISSCIRNNQSFTLVELLIVIGILAILTTTIVVVIKPDQVFKQARDSKRIADLQSVHNGIALFMSMGGTSIGTANTIYVSLPDDASSTCGSYSLPAPPATYSYSCKTAANYQKVDGTGWIPVNFTQMAGGSPMAVLPIDPTNSATDKKYYTYIPGGSWQLAAALESEKYKMGGASDAASKDGGKYPEMYETGNDFSLLPINYGDTGLKGYWKFDEGGSSATTYDSSGNGNTGTWSGTGTHYTSGKVGNYAGQFNGTDDYTTSTNSDSLNTPIQEITITAWVYSALSQTKEIVEKDAYYRIRLTNNKLQCAMNTTVSGWHWCTVGATTMGSTVWNFITWTYNGSLNSGKYYINGIDAGTNVASSGNLIPYGSNVTIAKGYSGYFNGYIDDVRIYNRVLSYAEITALYNATK